MRKAKRRPNVRIGAVRRNGKITGPAEQERLRLLHGPYTPPTIRVGREITCILRGKAKVCGWSGGRIAWPLIRVGHGGKGALVISPELARAVRCEAVSAIAHWWGVGTSTVHRWRVALGVRTWNEGTRRLWSLWKSPKLPDDCLTISKAVLREKRLAKSWTQSQVAKAMGWNSVNSYHQMETGGRWRATPETLQRLAKVLGCTANDLTARGA